MEIYPPAYLKRFCFMIIFTFNDNRYILISPKARRAFRCLMFHAMSTTKVSLSGETQWTNTLWQKWLTAHPWHPSPFTLDEDGENIQEAEWTEETETRPHPWQLVDLLLPSLREAALDSSRLQAEDTRTSASASLHRKQQRAEVQTLHPHRSLRNKLTAVFLPGGCTKITHMMHCFRGLSQPETCAVQHLQRPTETYSSQRGRGEQGCMLESWSKPDWV